MNLLFFKVSRVICPFVSLIIDIEAPCQLVNGLNLYEFPEMWQISKLREDQPDQPSR